MFDMIKRTKSRSTLARRKIFCEVQTQNEMGFSFLENPGRRSDTGQRKVRESNYVVRDRK